MKEYEIDEIDRKIMNLLRENARMPIKKSLNMSFCHRRLYQHVSQIWKSMDISPDTMPS